MKSPLQLLYESNREMAAKHGLTHSTPAQEEARELTDKLNIAIALLELIQVDTSAKFNTVHKGEPLRNIITKTIKVLKS